MLKSIIIMFVCCMLCKCFLNTWTKVIVAATITFAGIFWGYLTLIGNGEHATSSAVGDAALFTFCVFFVGFVLFCFGWAWVAISRAKDERHWNNIKWLEASNKADYEWTRTRTHL